MFSERLTLITDQLFKIPSLPKSPPFACLVGSPPRVLTHSFSNSKSSILRKLSQSHFAVFASNSIGKSGLEIAKILSLVTPNALGLWSIPIQFRPSFWATAIVVPPPIKQSKTVSPSLLPIFTIRSSKISGFCVG